MPFDPKIIAADDAFDSGAELKLPADLALMAEQLGDDAARLSACYPPPVAPALAAVSRQQTAAPSISRKSAWLTRSLAGTALAAGLVTISLVASNAYRPQRGNHSSPAAAHEAPSLDDSAPVPVTPASWLGDTSGPELEALMDLWEQEKHKKASLSF